MKIKLNLIIDSHNSNPTETLSIEDGIDEIFLSISGYDREIAVDRSELKKALSII